MFIYYTLVISICWVALFALCILVHENARFKKSDKRLLWITYLLIALSALAEWAGLWLNERAEVPRWVLTLVKCAIIR